MMGRADWNEPRYYSGDTFLDPTATEPPESAMIEIPGIETERSEFNHLRVIEKDVMDKYIVDGEIIDDTSAFDIDAKLIEDTENVCFVFAGEPTWLYWKWVGGTTATVNGGSWAAYKGEILSKASTRLAAGP